MFDSFIQYSAFQEILMKTVLISIPEEFFFVMFTLIFLGEFDYWKEAECKRLINRFDYVRVFVPTITGALISEILGYMGLKSSLVQFIPIITIYALLVATNDITSDAAPLKWMAKAFMFLMLAILIVGISEFIYIPFVLYGTGLTLSEVDNNFPLYFILSLPTRVVQYFILLYFVCKKRTLLKGKLIKSILSMPKLTVIFSFLLLINIVFLEMMVKAIAFDGMLVAMSHTSLTFVLIGVVLFSMLNISGIFWGFYHLKERDIWDKKIASDKLRSLQKKVELYTNNGNNDNIIWKFNEIGMDIERIADSLYTENTDKLES